MSAVKIILVVGVAFAVLLLISLLVNGNGIQLDTFTGGSQATNTFTLYYMTGCPHCETILPEFSNFVAQGQYESGGKKTTIRKIEQAAAGSDLEKYGIKGYPTFILEKSDGKFLSYEGERTVSAMKAFITQNAV
jgi:thiol-disulfide isomerase/thioredoxin